MGAKAECGVLSALLNPKRHSIFQQEHMELRDAWSVHQELDRLLGQQAEAAGCSQPSKPGYMYRMVGGYGQLCIGRDHGDKKVWEYVHRIVCALFHGVPAADPAWEAAGLSGTPLVLHWACKGNCIHPHHLRWGRKVQDLQDRHRNSRKWPQRPEAQRPFWPLKPAEDITLPATYGKKKRRGQGASNRRPLQLGEAVYKDVGRSRSQTKAYRDLELKVRQALEGARADAEDQGWLDEFEDIAEQQLMDMMAPARL